jgi:GTP-binding protein
VIVAANKVDRPDVTSQALTAELNSLGLGEPMPVSASHGLGTGDLLDRVTAELTELLGDDARADEEEPPPRIAILGRPNVGKSSLLNALLGSERVIVSDIAGTTRDPVDMEVELDGRTIVLVDTAGLRRRAKVGGSVNYYAQLRTEETARRADAAIVVCDAAEGITSEDMRIGELAMRSGCATVLALNKWDLASGGAESAEDRGVRHLDLEDARARAHKKLRLRPPLLTCSAKTGRGIGQVLQEALRLADRSAERIPTGELNRFVNSVVADRPPPQRHGRRLRLYYAAQIERRPPRMAIQVNDRALIDRSWAFHLENRVRDAYALQGVPLVIDFVPRKRDRGA